MAIAPAVFPEDLLDDITNFLVTLLSRCRLCSMIVAASRQIQGGADLADTMPGYLMYRPNHFAGFGWGEVPRINAFRERSKIF